MSVPVLEVERPAEGETPDDRLELEQPVLDDDIGNGDEEGYDGDGGSSEDDGAGGEAPPPQAPLSDERRDRVILETVAILVAGWVVLMAAVLIAGALGLIRPVCGGIFVTQTAGCDRSAPAFDPATAKEWAPYVLEDPSVTLPITASQPGPEAPR